MRGFALLTPERRRELAQMGGRKAHRMGKAHRWTSEEAKRVGALGGQRAQAKRRATLEEKTA